MIHILLDIQISASPTMCCRVADCDPLQRHIISTSCSFLWVFLDAEQQNLHSMNASLDVRDAVEDGERLPGVLDKQWLWKHGQKFILKLWLKRKNSSLKKNSCTNFESIFVNSVLHQLCVTLLACIQMFSNAFMVFQRTSNIFKVTFRFSAPGNFYRISDEALCNIGYSTGKHSISLNVSRYKSTHSNRKRKYLKAWKTITAEIFKTWKRKFSLLKKNSGKNVMERTKKQDFTEIFIVFWVILEMKVIADFKNLSLCSGNRCWY